MTAICWELIARILILVPWKIRHHFAYLLFTSSKIKKDGQQGVKELFGYEDLLKSALDECAVGLENGIHPKHRLTEYHQFFIQRIQTGERILDIGCGNGALSFSLAEAGAEVVALDCDKDQVERARRQYCLPNLTFQVNDIEKKVPDGKFDVLVMSNVLEHLINRVVVLKTLHEKTAATRLLIRVPALHRDWSVLYRKELGLPWFSDPTHQIEYTTEILGKELVKACWRPVFMCQIWGEIWAECANG